MIKAFVTMVVLGAAIMCIGWLAVGCPVPESGFGSKSLEDRLCRQACSNYLNRPETKHLNVIVDEAKIDERRNSCYCTFFHEVGISVEDLCKLKGGK